MNEEQKQTCSKCSVEKSVNEFYFRKDTNKLVKKCKTCVLERQSKYYTENKEKSKQYRIKNKEKIKEYEKNFQTKNRERINAYYRNRRQNNETVRLIDNTRRRINGALNGKSKSFHTKEILGIDVETYKKWIDFQMTAEMNFNNIHIDHVKPISSFDVSNDNELLKAFNWKNTQPLLKEDNFIKSNKLNELDYQLQFIKAYQFI